jgi:integrase
MKTRRLATGKTVNLHHNDGLRKRCDCARRDWLKCSHSWSFSYKWKGTHHRFPLDRYATAHIATKDEARAEVHRHRAAIQETGRPAGSSGPTAALVTPSDRTFQQFADLWRERGRDHRSDTQKKNDDSIVRSLCALCVSDNATLGGRAIGSLTDDDFESAFGHLTVAGSTWNKYFQMVMNLQRWGVRKGHLARPWLTEGSDLERRKNAQRKRRLTADVVDAHGKITANGEERQLLAHASPWLQRLIIAAIETGCRRGELLSLQWRDVSFPRAELTIRAENGKTDEARVIPISSRFRAVLDMIKLDPKGTEHPSTAFVFGNATGEKVSDPKKSYLKACKEGEISNLHFHDLRHEAGSRWAEAGMPLHEVSYLLGHKNLKTTTVYLNIHLTSVHASIRKLDAGRTFDPSTLLPVVAHSQTDERQHVVQASAASLSKSLVN